MKYRILIEGSNANIVVDNDLKKVGFYTTRFVEERSPEYAANKAVELTLNELRTVASYTEDDQPILSIEEITELDSFEDVERPGSGFTWYIP